MAEAGELTEGNSINASNSGGHGEALNDEQKANQLYNELGDNFNDDILDRLSKIKEHHITMIHEKKLTQSKNQEKLIKLAEKDDTLRLQNETMQVMKSDITSLKETVSSVIDAMTDSHKLNMRKINNLQTEIVDLNNQNEELNKQILHLNEEILDVKLELNDNRIININLILNTIFENMQNAFIIIIKKYQIGALFVMDNDDKIKICNKLNITVDELDNMELFQRECNLISEFLTESGHEYEFSGIKLGHLAAGITMNSQSITNFLQQFTEFVCDPMRAIDTINGLCANNDKNDNKSKKWEEEPHNNAEQKEDFKDENENDDNNGLISETPDTKSKSNNNTIIENQQENHAENDIDDEE